MFSSIRERTFSEVQTSLQKCLPNDCIELTLEYIHTEEEEKYEDRIVKIFHSNPFYFFKENFQSNCCSGARVSGVLLRFIFLSPLFMLEGIIFSIFYCMYCCDGQESDKNIDETNALCVSRVVFDLIKPLGIAIGLIISIIPAIILSLANVKDRPSGETVYKLLKDFNTLATSNLNRHIHKANCIIDNIIREYNVLNENGNIKDIEFPGYLFSRDEKSEKLYRILKNEKLSLEKKAEEIALYMETKSRNGGKDLYHIILNELNPSTSFEWWEKPLPENASLLLDHGIY